GCMNGRSPAVLAGGALCEEPAWFVGSVDPQVQRHFSHTFVLHNQTDKSIPIAQVKPDCACLVSENLPKAIPARISAEIHVGFNASQVPEPFDHAVLVKLGLKDPAILFLKIRG